MPQGMHSIYVTTQRCGGFPGAWEGTQRFSWLTSTDWLDCVLTLYLHPTQPSHVSNYFSYILIPNVSLSDHPVLLLSCFLFLLQISSSFPWSFFSFLLISFSESMYHCTLQSIYAIARTTFFILTYLTNHILSFPVPLSPPALLLFPVLFTSQPNAQQ